MNAPCWPILMSKDVKMDRFSCSSAATKPGKNPLILLSSSCSLVHICPCDHDRWGGGRIGQHESRYTDRLSDLRLRSHVWNFPLVWDHTADTPEPCFTSLSSSLADLHKHTHDFLFGLSGGRGVYPGSPLTFMSTGFTWLPCQCPCYTFICRIRQELKIVLGLIRSYLSAYVHKHLFP